MSFVYMLMIGFQIRLSNANLCITSEKDIKSKGSFLVLKSCLRAKNQVIGFVFNLNKKYCCILSLQFKFI